MGHSVRHASVHDAALPAAFRLNPDTREVIGPNGTWRASKQRATILRMLVEAHGRCVSHFDIISTLYEGQEEPEDASNIVKVQVCKLRKCLADIGLPDIVRLVWGAGYLLACPAEAVVTVSAGAMDALRAENARLKQLLAEAAY